MIQVYPDYCEYCQMKIWPLLLTTLISKYYYRVWKNSHKLAEQPMKKKNFFYLQEQGIFFIPPYVEQ